VEFLRAHPDTNPAVFFSQASCLSVLREIGEILGQDLTQKSPSYLRGLLFGDAGVGVLFQHNLAALKQVPNKESSPVWPWESEITPQFNDYDRTWLVLARVLKQPSLAEVLTIEEIHRLAVLNHYSSLTPEDKREIAKHIQDEALLQEVQDTQESFAAKLNSKGASILSQTPIDTTEFF
jgi:hypothetical protein